MDEYDSILAKRIFPEIPSWRIVPPVPIDNPLDRPASCIVSRSSRDLLSGVAFVSAVGLEIPGREGLFRRCLLTRTFFADLSTSILVSKLKR